MDLLYCGDEHMRDGLLISLLSLLEHTTVPLNVHVLTATIDVDGEQWSPLKQEDIDYLDRLVRQSPYSGGVELIDVTEQFKAQPPTANLKTRFSPYCMLRLYADLVDLPDRILYLDTDVVCKSDPSELWQADMHDRQIAGVPDHFGFILPTANWFTKPFCYLNSGVLLLNMPYIRETGLFAKCRDLCSRKRMFLCDQTAINRLARKRRVLPRRFNEQIKTRPDTILRHFTTTLHMTKPHTITVKPWDVPRMHSVLDEHAYDTLLQQYQYHIARMDDGLDDDSGDNFSKNLDGNPGDDLGDNPNNGLDLQGQTGLALLQEEGPKEPEGTEPEVLESAALEGEEEPRESESEVLAEEPKTEPLTEPIPESMSEPAAEPIR